MSKISFDFDETLSCTNVQMYAHMCVKSEHDVHIVTSRMSNERAGNPSWNDDLYMVASQIGIPEENIHFCNLSPKYKFFLDNPDFLFHLDDDKDDVDGINFHKEDPNGTIGVFFVNTFTDVVFSTLNNLIMYGEPVREFNIKPDKPKND